MNQEILFENRDEWKNWLKKYHDKKSIIWLIYYKKHSNKKSVKQSEAVEEALCYGWIDSIVRRLDDERYMQKFTPRNDNSIWSDLNKKRVSQLIKNGKMIKYGMKKVNIAKKSGMWTKIRKQTDLKNIPIEFEETLKANKIAKENFEKLAPSYKKQYLYWFNDAKREDTKKRRIAKVIKSLEKGEILGMI